MSFPWMKPAFVWTPEMDALLGETPDNELAEKLGCCPETVRKRRNQLGIPATRRQPVPDSLRSRARAAGLDHSTVVNRIRAGWSEEKALSTPARKKKIE